MWYGWEVCLCLDIRHAFGDKLGPAVSNSFLGSMVAVLPGPVVC